MKLLFLGTIISILLSTGVIEGKNCRLQDKQTNQKSPIQKRWFQYKFSSSTKIGKKYAKMYCIAGCFIFLHRNGNGVTIKAYDYNYLQINPNSSFMNPLLNVKIEEAVQVIEITYPQTRVTIFLRRTFVKKNGEDWVLVESERSSDFFRRIYLADAKGLPQEVRRLLNPVYGIE
jgi:hypothetical protein